VQDLTEFQKVAERLGGSAEGVASGIDSMQQALSRVKNIGPDPIVPILRERLGIDVQKDDGTTKDLITELIPEMHKEIQRQLKAGTLTGPDVKLLMGSIGAPQLAPVMMQSDEEFEKQQTRVRSIGTVTEEETKRSREMANALQNVNDLFRRMGEIVTFNVTPGIKDATEGMFDWIQANREWITQDISAAINTLSGAVKMVGDDLKKAFNSETGKQLRSEIGAVTAEMNKLAEASGGWTRVLANGIEWLITYKLARFIYSLRAVQALVAAIGLGSAPGLAVGALGLAMYEVEKAKSRQQVMEELGYKVTMVDPNVGNRATQYMKDGKYYTLDDEKKIVDAHLAELKKVADAEAEAAKRLEEANAKAAKAGGGGGGAGAGAGGGGAGGGPSFAPPAKIDVSADTLQTGATIRDRAAADLNIPPEASSGLVGNLLQESGLEAGIEERGGGGGLGIAQWTADRRDRFEAYLRKHNLPASSMEGNYGFLIEELKGPQYAGLLEDLRNLKGTREERRQQATMLIRKKFEAPAEWAANDEARQAYAAKVDAIPSKTTAPTPQPTAATDTTPSPAPATSAAPKWNYGYDEKPPPAAPPRPPALPEGVKPGAWRTGYGRDEAVPADATAAKPGTTPALPPVPPAPAAPPRVELPALSMSGASMGAQRSLIASSTSIDHSRSSETHVGEVHVHTQATDAPGIARDLKRELRRYDYATSSDIGLA
jgi:hypothetical protein